MNNKFMEKLTVGIEKLAVPLTKFANIPSVAAITEGLIACMGPILVGSIFLVIGIFSWSGSLIEGRAVLPFLEPYGYDIALLNSLTLGFLGLYAAFNIAIAYGKKVDVDAQAAGTLGLISFLLINIDTLVDGTIATASFGVTGLFPAMIVSIVVVKVYKFFIDKNIIIKMPKDVPPAVGKAFASIIPFFVIFVVCWFIRTILDFDLTTFLGGLLAPILGGADNIVAFTGLTTLNNVLWSVGLHGGNMLSPIIYPLELAGLTANSEALVAGTALNQLPAVWASGLQYLCVWTAPIWSLLILMACSKVKFFRTFSFSAIPAAIFSIVEPVIFGLPLALNPYLIVPFILSTLVSAFFTYGVFALGLVNRFFAALPWALPPFVSGPIATGDLKVLIVIAVNVIIGIVIYFPFFKVYEKAELAKQEAN